VRKLESRNILGEAADCLHRVMQPVAHIIHNIGYVFLTLMMFLVFSDVMLRYFFNKPILGSFDVTELMMGVFIACCLAYCAIENGNVKTEVLVERLPVRAQEIIDTVTSFIGLIFFSLITWQSFIQAQSAFDSQVMSAVLHIPTFPFVAIVAFGCFLLTLVLLSDFLTFLSKALKK